MQVRGAYGYAERPPPGIRRVLWRISIWLDGSLAFSMLEPWELAIVWTLIVTVTLLFWVSVFTYLPSQASYMARRFAYYVYGEEGADPLAGVRSALGGAVGRGLEIVRGKSEL